MSKRRPIDDQVRPGRPVVPGPVDWQGKGGAQVRPGKPVLPSRNVTRPKTDPKPPRKD